MSEAWKPARPAAFSVDWLCKNYALVPAFRAAAGCDVTDQGAPLQALQVGFSNIGGLLPPPSFGLFDFCQSQVPTEILRSPEGRRGAIQDGGTVCATAVGDEVRYVRVVIHNPHYLGLTADEALTKSGRAVFMLLWY